MYYQLTDDTLNMQKHDALAHKVGKNKTHLRKPIVEICDEDTCRSAALFLCAKCEAQYCEVGLYFKIKISTLLL